VERGLEMIGVEILVILLLVALNGVLAMSEIALVSARKARLQELANQGDPRARLALEMAEAPTRFLSTVQIGITLVGVLAGAFGGATLAEEIAERLRVVPGLGPYSEVLGVGLVVLGITYLSLVLGELVPKRLALYNPERVAAAVATPMRVLAAAAAPAVHLLSLSTEMIIRAMGIRPRPEPPVTDEEIRILMEQGIQAGTFEETELDLVERVFRLRDRRVSELMTPRTEIVWLEVDDPPERIRRKIAEGMHSRFPVCRGGLDHVLGVVEVKALLPQVLAGRPMDLTTSLQEPVFVTESMSALKALELFQRSRTALVLVVDEYGSIQGLLTPSDLLEELVGEIALGDAARPESVRREGDSWILDGRLPLTRLKDLLGWETLPDEEKGYYHTVGGFVLARLGRIPSVGDRFEWGGVRFEVVAMDRHRVAQVRVSPVAPPSTSTSTSQTRRSEVSERGLPDADNGIPEKRGEGEGRRGP